MRLRIVTLVAALGVGLLGFSLLGSQLGLRAATGQNTPAGQTGSCLTGGHWGMMDGWQDWDTRSPGMMGGGGMMRGAGANNAGAMWGMMGSAGMMGWETHDAQPISEDAARQQLAAFATSCGADVHVSDVMDFASNYYAQLVDGSGNGLGEVIVDRYSGTVSPEPGPNMMWNTGWGAGSTGTTKYDLPAARQLAETFLTRYLPGAHIVAGQQFPGYATFDFGHEHAEAMLSVNTSTGDIWVHTWHGPALSAVDHG